MVLIEAMAAVAVLALLIGLAWPLIPFRTTPARLLALASASASLLRDTRTDAIRSGAPVAVRFDAGRRRLEGPRAAVTMPLDVDASLVAGGNCPAARTGAEIVFRPDGSSCGAVLRLRTEQRAVRARVNWISGHVDVVEGG